MPSRRDARLNAERPFPAVPACPRASFRVLTQRRGSIYLAVLGVAILVAICALAGMHLARVDLKNTRQANDLQEAQLLANSAVEWAVSDMNSTPNYNNLWRTVYSSGVEKSSVSVGNGKMSFMLVDDDGDLANGATDPVWIYGKGRVGDSVWVERARARGNRGKPLECLRTALHCSQELQVGWGDVLTPIGAMASTDANLLVNGTVVGDVQAVTMSGAGNVTGAKTVPASRKGVPWPSVFNDYVARATQIPYQFSIQQVVLAPGVNELSSGLNAKGIYYIKTNNNSMIIQQIRLQGTLVIDAGSGTVLINNVCLMEPASEDYPVLIIKGDTILAVQNGGGSQYLSESDFYHNFNPSGAPYLGVTDSDKADNYPSKIRGLVHIIGDLAFINDTTYWGTILVQGKATMTSGSPTIIWDPNLIMNPPLGYSSDPTSMKMILQPQTLSRQPSF